MCVADERAREVRAHYDDAGVVVYQAFSPHIAEDAVRLQTMGRGFTLERMTWIKPSFGWMLYRSGYARKHRQERILRIRLAHGGFRAILAEAIPTAFTPGLFSDDREWSSALRQSRVRYQWDPDRDLRLVRLDRRAIQLGIRGEVVARYVQEWILGVEDVTELALEIERSVRSRQELPTVPEERVYPVDETTRRSLGMDLDA